MFTNQGRSEVRGDPKCFEKLFIIISIILKSCANFLKFINSIEKFYKIILQFKYFI